jgi:hypothetical protein
VIDQRTIGHDDEYCGRRPTHHQQGKHPPKVGQVAAVLHRLGMGHDLNTYPIAQIFLEIDVAFRQGRT